MVFIIFQSDRPVEQSDEHYDDSEWADSKEASREMADWEERMSNEQDETEDESPSIRIPEDEAEAVEIVAESRGEGWAEEHRELIIAQAKLIGDL